MLCTYNCLISSTTRQYLVSSFTLSPQQKIAVDCSSDSFPYRNTSIIYILNMTNWACAHLKTMPSRLGRLKVWCHSCGGLLVMVVVCWWWTVLCGSLLCGSLPYLPNQAQKISVPIHSTFYVRFFWIYSPYILRTGCNKRLRRFSAREIRHNFEGYAVLERWFATRNMIENNPIKTLHSVKKDFEGCACHFWGWICSPALTIKKDCVDSNQSNFPNQSN